ncbi:CBO0543 family protein [Evansella sp. AB-rgal1]|uniref:CBO0543 family protein n=1 Tax=Evansella sp. AB-rgal1 TaxID=3242696 RepID=UPI00359E7F33
MPSLFQLSATSNKPSWNEIIDLRIEIRDMVIDYWLYDTLFSFNWWFLLITTIATFVIWLIVLDKSRLLEIMTFGLLIGTIVFVLDTIGITLVLWSYPDKLIPLIPPILEIHKIHIPIIYMIIYQYFHSWKTYSIVLVITSAIFAFVLEPITNWLGIYEIYHWKYTYSFPIYFILGVWMKWTITKVIRLEKSRKG